MLYHVKNNIKTPATLSVTQFKQLYPVPYELADKNNYYIKESSYPHQEFVYMLPEPLLEDENVTFYSLQKVTFDNKYEPVISIGDKLYKGYGKIMQYLGIDNDTPLARKYVDALLIPYATFSVNSVKFNGLEVSNSGKISPVFSHKNRKGNGRYFGFTGLRRLFPYTSHKTLSDFYNNHKQPWNTRFLNSEELIYKYSIIKEGSLYKLERYNKPHSFKNQKELISFLRASGEIVPTDVVKNLFKEIKSITIEDSIFKRYQITEVGYFIFKIVNKETGDIEIIKTKNGLQKFLDVNWKQLDRIMDDDRMTKDYS